PTPLNSILFPYTTLFRSSARWARGAGTGGGHLSFYSRVAHVRPPLTFFDISGEFGRRNGGDFVATKREMARKERIKAEEARLRRSEEHTSELQSRENLVC